MSPSDIKTNVQSAYSKAIANQNLMMSHNSLFPQRFRDLKLYGCDAGIDFVETNLDFIVKEAVEIAKCKLGSMELSFYGSGRAAIGSVADTLRDLTSLNVEIQQNVVRVIWAVPNPGLV